MPYYVYIMTTKRNTALYTGVTNDLVKRTAEHKLGVTKGFTNKYHVEKLIYYEVFEDSISAITREKQIKGGSRQKKVDLVRRLNLKWEDLSLNL